MTRHLLIAALTLLVGALPVPAQDAQELNDTRIGVLTYGGNALLNDSKIDDPAEYRGGAPPTQRSLVKFSGDVKEGSRREGHGAWPLAVPDVVDLHGAARVMRMMMGNLLGLTLVPVFAETWRAVETHTALERWAAFAVGFFLTAGILLLTLS